MELVGASGGILVLGDDQALKAYDVIRGVFSIPVAFEFPNVGVIIMTIYGPQSTKGRKAFWEELGSLFGLCEGRWCVTGDFHVIRYPLEKSSGGVKLGP